MPEFDRRDFLKLVGAGAGAAATAGCSEPVEKLIPYVVQPEEITPGLPVWYASTCRECPAACGLHVKTREGRPIKLEGNPEHPVNRGALCARGQAGTGRLYHPDRFPGPMRRGPAGGLEPVSWDEALQTVADAVAKAPARTHVLGGDPGPTASGVVDRFVRAVGAGGRTVYEPFAREALREASRTVFGRASEPVFDVSGADLVLDFGSEMLETGLSPTEHARQLAEAQDVDSHEEGGARLVYLGPRLSMTASNADEWLTARPGTEGVLALALARVAVEAGAGGGRHDALLSGALAGADVESAARSADVPAEAIRRLGRALARAQRPVALPPGVAVASRRAVGATAAVLLLDHVIGAVGRSVQVPPEPEERRPRASYRDVLALVKAMEEGEVGVLLVHDANPVYSLPAASGFAAALENVPLVVSFASAADETTARAHLVLPDHTPLESWGDAQPRPGVRSLVQPAMRPLYDTRAFPDALLDLGRALGEPVASQLPAGSFRTLLEEAWADTDLRAAKARGGVFQEAPTAPPVELAGRLERLEVAEPKLTGEGDHVLLPFPHGFLWDGRGANLPWLQEIPDTVTKIAWQTWAEVSSATAERLGLELGDVVAIETSAGRVEVPVFPRGGLRDDVVAVPIGQGHTVGHFASRDGAPRGVNILDALPAAVDESGGRAWLTERATLRPTGRSERVALFQTTDNKRGRMLGEAISLVELAEGGAVAGVRPFAEGAQKEFPGRAESYPTGAAGHGGGEGARAAGHGGEGHGDGHAEGGHEALIGYDPREDAVPGQPYRWGMSVDLDRCTGCSACVAACYVENNIPVVGEEETIRRRQMEWLRIERYVGDGDPELRPGRSLDFHSREKLGDTDVRHSPMLCQHCGSAPCEPVCPVIAAYHDDEGLNGQIYNRCIGTRYCANNCSYKVRRFNYFDHQIHRWPEPMRLGLNPDVTVRGQGVMEKCTFCLQRIHAARQTAKDEGRPIADGEVVTACQQACPAEAITFGNLRDEQSAVVKKSRDPQRGYHALHVLNTRPAITYLAKVRRGPVEG